MDRKPPAPSQRIPGLFITGTDTGVGKTHVAAMIVRALTAAGHRVGVYKPAASGCARDPATGELVSDDALALWRAAGEPVDLAHVAPQTFAAALTPHRAAAAEGRTLDAAAIRSGLEYWLGRSDIVVVEGAGGLFSPLGENELNIDIAAEFGFPLVVVAANRLGTLHATLATLHAAARYAPDLPIMGIVLNDATADDGGDESRSSNEAELRTLLDVPLLTHVDFGQLAFREPLDWRARAQTG